MSAPVHAKVVIIGSGPAGYTAAIYAARAMLEPILIQGIQPGGQLTITTDVENYQGFVDVIQGPCLMEQMEKQAVHVGTKIVSDLVTRLDTAQRPFRLTCDSGDVYLADTVILATGAQARWLGLPSEAKFQGGGVSACATCDGFFYRGKEVIVVGGGNTAVEEALFLTNFASQVTIVHRRDHFRAERILQDRLFKHPKIKVVWDSAIEEICGAENPSKVTHVRLKNVKTGALTGSARGRRLHRHRPCPGHRPRCGPDQAEILGLCRGRAELDRNLDTRPVCRRRCRGRDLPAGGHGCRPGLHGGPRSRTFPGIARERSRRG